MVNLTPTARVILGFLKLGARTGYDIKRYADVSTRFFWGASYGQIYPELKRLADAGLIRGEEDPRGAVSRTAYTLTAKGEDALHRSLTEHPEDLVFEYRDEALLRLFFGDVLTPGEVAENLRGARAEFAAVAERFREIDASREPGDTMYPPLALQYGIELMEWIAEWYRRAGERLAADELKAEAQPPPRAETAARAPR
jgi:DNA-binding PadR family transcriptional regulator